jgi:hypothetical protein
MHLRHGYVHKDEGVEEKGEKTRQQHPRAHETFLYKE